MDNSEAIDALIELGLSTYEARVFTALIELGEGTAREVAKTSDVPRSQVYTTAKEL
ncbi:helix-turn-helix domain-containing protein [Haloferax sp. AS1]|nr:helix-turn-helix domain-containing protein [Haloferax sp. AS1]